MTSHTARKLAATAALLATALTLSSCAQSDLRLGPDYGVAVRTDLAAQIADPDAQYAGVPAPATNGVRTAAAVNRYNTNKVVQPASTTTSDVAGGGATSTAAPSTSPIGPS